MREPWTRETKILLIGAILSALYVAAAWLSVPGFPNPFKKSDTAATQPHQNPPSDDDRHSVGNDKPVGRTDFSKDQKEAGDAPSLAAPPKQSDKLDNGLATERDDHILSQAASHPEPVIFDDCEVSGGLTVKKASARLVSTASASVIEAFVQVGNASDAPIGFVQIGPAEFTDSVGRRTESSRTTASFFQFLPGPGGTAIIGLAKSSQRLVPGESTSVELDFPVASDTKALKGELLINLATFDGQSLSSRPNFNTTALRETLRCGTK